jgi:hypothetical protein
MKGVGSGNRRPQWDLRPTAIEDSKSPAGVSNSPLANAQPKTTYAEPPSTTKTPTIAQQQHTIEPPKHSTEPPTAEAPTKRPTKQQPPNTAQAETPTPMLGQQLEIREQQRRTAQLDRLTKQRTLTQTSLHVRWGGGCPS